MGSYGMSRKTRNLSKVTKITILFGSLVYCVVLWLLLTNWNFTRVNHVQLDVPSNIHSENMSLEYLMETITSLKDYESIFYGADIVEELQTSVQSNIFNPEPNYKNICWRSSLKTHRTSIRKAWSLRCFPYTMLIGVSKSGTTDLYDKIGQHPDMYPPRQKEVRYWNRQRIGSMKFGDPDARMSFQTYVSAFNDAADDILNHYTLVNGTQYHDAITFEATPHYMWDSDGWQHLPGNRDLDEPKYMLPHTLHVIAPNMKFLVILRNPTDRLYSQYKMLSVSAARPDLFHQMVVETIEAWTGCRETSTERSCAYNGSVYPYEYTRPGGITLRAGMYTIFLTDWFSVYSPHHFHVIHAEDYYTQPVTTLGDVFDFLEMKKLSEEEIAVFLQRPIRNSSKDRGRRTSLPMLNETRQLLDGFYASFNVRLSRLLGDSRFLF